MKTVELTAIAPNPANPRIIRDEQFARLVASIKRDPEYLEKRGIIHADGVILGGNMRYRAIQEALKDATFRAALKARYGIAKAGVIPAAWLLDASDWDEEKRRRFVLVDNAPPGMAGDWDWDALGNEWDDLPLVDLGFDMLKFGDQEAGEDSDAEPQVDKAKELNKTWKVSTGDLWAIGDHRLLCGDSTKAEDVAGIMGRVSQNTLVFDPPWDIMVDECRMGAFQNTLVFTDGQRCGQSVTLFGAPCWVFIWDCQACWFTPNRPLKRVKLCLWYGALDKYNMNGAHYGDAGEQRRVSNTRGEYEFKPDPRGKHLADLFETKLTAEHIETGHHHSKPLDWVRLLLGNCTQGTVYDPFLGSGTTMVACQNLGRKCYGIEISPGYCAVILQRMRDAFPDITIEKGTEK